MYLDDPVAAGVIRGLAEIDCKALYECSKDRVDYFKGRIAIRELSVNEWVIIMANADDLNGKVILDALMPDHDWQQYRDAGMIPCGRGLCRRDWLHSVLESFDTEAAENLLIPDNDTIVVVVNSGIASVYTEE